MPEISNKKHLPPSFCKYLLTISHGKKNIPRKILPSRDVCNTFFYLLALVLLQGVLIVFQF